MAKAKTVFFCKECGFESAKWMGQCPGCKNWDTFVSEPVIKKTSGIRLATGLTAEPELLSKVSAEEEQRIITGIQELDRVLGGGIVIGSLVLVGGDPGIGKSTLLLQMCRELSGTGKKVLYISGEESLRQIKMRADRLGIFHGELFLLSETNLDQIEDIIKKQSPEIVIIDSIQTMFKEDIGAAPGSVSQVRETTAILMRIAKGLNISIFIVGHVTKEGVVAGPRVLEHMVDTVLYFEGENMASYRILRAVKNRFGSTNEIGVFEMRDIGLTEVSNPSEFMLQGKPEDEPGSVVTASMEGTRPILVEVQALVCQTNFNMPRRTAAGTDYNRVNLLMAVVEKRLGIQMAGMDAYINVAGGMKINEPALDLAIVLAILSSYKNFPLDSKTIVFGEIGLTGEVRAVNMIEQRVQEASKMGFHLCILPQVNKETINLSAIPGMKVIGVKNIREILNLLR
ncbi:DNA repair protein RadA [Anaerocolumna cellulosilytica]|uniref:DNA repair protein RadA n=1 Tax=Anaerocolumna cellulosilytica TaxID=433286 RepID=A0A6S6QQ45_9FIRM|nr:DNA repair protein RadA [Anaerocolumna cellulosilytica]MBB5194518.1 DNA repair protein RadA/Sms [Anaerocolumna cellulosilytica]BCJ93463.1 DNA repair protein RadA [Anaerocolumna cellulosilytica]